MKFILTKLLSILALLVLGLSNADSQTLNWGSPFSESFTSNLADSQGNALNDTYTFEIGTFGDGFNPNAANAADWYTHWKAFDAASFSEGTFDPATGYVTATADMNPSGFSTSPDATSNTFNFSGLEAFLWVRNSNSPGTNSEWALVRAGSWTFPTADPECCPSEFPVNWSVSDLTSEVPVYGGQGGIQGDGVHSVSGSYFIQTYTFAAVPEPSAVLMIGMAALALARRRRS